MRHKKHREKELLQNLEALETHISKDQRGVKNNAKGSGTDRKARLVNVLYKNGFGTDELLMPTDMAIVLNCSPASIEAALKSALFKLKGLCIERDLIDYLPYVVGRNYECN